MAGRRAEIESRDRMTGDAETNRPDATGDERWRPTIAAVLSIGFAGLVLVAVGAVLWISLDAAQKNTFTLLRQSAELTLESLVGRVELQLASAEHQSAFLAKLLADGEVDPQDDARLEQVMLGSLAAAPEISGIVFVEPDYRARRVGRLRQEFIRRDDNWGQRLGVVEWIDTMRRAEGLVWLGTLWVEDMNAAHIAAAHPVRRDGRFIGTVASILSVRGLSEFLDRINRQYDIKSFILSGRDHVVAHPALAGGSRGLSAENPMPRLGEVNDANLARIWDPPIDRMPDLLAGSNVRGHVVEQGDDQVIFLYREVESFGPEPWIFGIYLLGSETGGEFERLILAAGVGLAILVVAVLLALLLGRGIAQPLRRLSDASVAVRELDIRKLTALPRSQFRETDQAASAYNAMINALRWFETYVPRALVLALMRSGESAVRSEERQVSVIFTDIVGFSQLAGEMPAPDLAAFLNEHFSLLAACIEAEDGTVDKYIGDSVMAFWGAPGVQPDHASRACRAALAMAAALESDNRTRLERGLVPVRVRIGIHSGPAVVGNIGAPGRVNYTLIGDTVNVAQRLEGLGHEVADADAAAVLLISEDTRRDLAPGFETRGLGARLLRGRRGEVEVFRLLG